MSLKMRQCIFAKCKFRPDNRVGNVELVHRFPQEEHIQKQWVQWVRDKCAMPTFEYNTKAGLCYRHFERHCYHQSNGLLKPFSYPSFTPQDLDNIVKTGLSTEVLSMNGIPKTNLIIKVDPTLVKNSTTKNSDPGKKLVFLVTDKGMLTSQAPNSHLTSISQMEAGVRVIRTQDVPPLRYIGRERAAHVLEIPPSNEEKLTPTIENNLCLVEPQLSGNVTYLPSRSDIFTSQEKVPVSEDTFYDQSAKEQQILSKSTADCQSDRLESYTGDSITRSHRTLNVIQTVLNSSRRRIHLYRRRLQQEKKKTSKLEELLDELKNQKLISVAVAEKIEAILHDE